MPDGKPKAIRSTYRCHRCPWIGRRNPQAAAKPCPKCGDEPYVAAGPPRGRTVKRVTVHLPMTDLQALGDPKEWRKLIRLAVASLAQARRQASASGVPSSGLTRSATAV